MGKVGEEAGSRETSINDAKKSENGGRQGQEAGIGHPGGGVDGKTLKYDVKWWGEVLVARGHP